MKVTTIFFILAIIIAPTFTLNSDSGNRILQASARSQSFTKMCATFSDRKSIVDQKSKTDAQANNASMYATFKITGNQLISGIINNPDLASGAASAIPNIQTALGLFAGPFAIGLVIILLSWWFLCCCCCCPSCCPSKCCQKPESQQYTKCQLFWPAITLILALLLLIVASVIGITRASDIQSSYTAVSCSVAITADDLLNGNISTQGKYFLGMNNLIGGLNGLQSNLGAVNTQIGKITFSNTSGTLRQAYDAGTALLVTVSQIPTGTANGAMSNYGYKNFDGTGTTSSVPSSFPTFLGTTNPSGASGAVDGLHSAIDQINQGLKLIGDNADTFFGQFGSIGSIISSALDPLDALKTLLTGLDSSFSSVDDAVGPIMNIVTLAVTAIFGVFIGLGVLSILGTVLMTFCDKYSCRYLVYFVCVILFILGIISFLLAFIFSIITPILYLGCDFINVSFSSPTAFNTNLGSKLGAQISPLVSVCLPGGSGDIINQIQGVNMSAITGLTSTISSMQSFSVSTLQNGVTTAINTFEGQVNKYYYTDVYDFNSAPNKAILANIANPANYNCLVNSFTQDSWVPSLRQTDIPCSVTTSQASATQCPDTAAFVGGRGSSVGCFGCIDSTKVFYTAGPTNTSIENRYTTAGDCGVWALAMKKVFTEYYTAKKAAIDPIKTRIASTRSSYTTATTGYRDRIGAVGTSFTNIVNTLQNVVSSIVDPNYGMVAGMNCLLLGQDINLISNTLCTKFFNTFYFLRLTLGLAAFGILFTMFCSTCSGVRAFKHSQRVGSILPKQMSMNQQQSTMAALNAKH